LTLHLHDRVRGVSSEPDRVLLNFAVDDLTSWHERLSSAGGPCLRPPSPEPWGGLVATYADPDGNEIQLIQF
ncbi:MAG: VOC family protein, partial [Acidimicrobiia bacterium]